MSLWRKFGRQLACPSGLGGALTGTLMRLVNRQPNDLAIAALALKSDDDVLELGFGPGDAIARIVPKVARGSVSGIDLSRAMHRKAFHRNQRAIRRGRVHLERGDFRDLPFPDRSFDKVLAVNTAYFWHEDRKIISEIRRVLRPGGRLVLFVTDAGTLQRWKFASTETHRHFDAGSLVEMLVEGGFDRDLIGLDSRRLSAGVLGLIATVILAPGSWGAKEGSSMEQRAREAKALRAMRSAVTAFMAISAASPSHATDIKVTVTNVIPGGGPIRLDLFAKPEGFRHEDQAVNRDVADATGSTVEMIVKNLSPGRYAIMAYQDANRNGRLDLRFGMFPKEAWGLSNDPKMLGPPSYAACAFDVGEQARHIDIPLHH